MPCSAASFGQEPFTLAEAARLGLSRDDVRRLVAAGAVHRLLRGAYVDASAPDGLGLRAVAVAKVVPPGRVVCGRTAAWLWGVDALAMGAHRILPDVDVMTPAGGSAARRAGVLGCSGALPTQDVVRLGSVQVTTPARTAADLARLLRRPDALASLDAILRLPDLDAAEVARVLTRFGGHRGVVQGRELLELASPLAESPQESRARLRCVDAGFPMPEPQIVVRREDGGFVARLDMGWRDWCKALEFDGDEHHSDAVDQAHDLWRRSRVEACGWGIAVVTTGEVMGRGLAFERGIAELLGRPFRLTRHHPSLGGWDGRSRWSAA